MWAVLDDPACADIAGQLQRDAAAEAACSAGSGPSVRIWEASGPAVTLPAHAEARADELAALLAQGDGSGWSVAVRCTGGAPFPQGPGVVAVTLIAGRGEDGMNDPQAVYRRSAAIVAGAIRRLGLRVDQGACPASFCSGAFDLGTGGRKLAGFAQWWGGRRRRHPGVMLLHAGILADLDIPAAVAAVNRVARLAGLPGTLDARASTSIAEALGPRTGGWAGPLRRSLAAEFRDSFNLAGTAA